MNAKVSMKVKVMRQDRTLCEMPYEFLFDHGANLGYAEAEDGVWVPQCDLDQYNAGRRKPVLSVSEVLRKAAGSVDSSNVLSSDLISIAIDHDGLMTLHLDSIAFAIHAVNAIATGIQLTISESESNQRFVQFARDGVKYIGFVPTSVVEEWQLSESCVG